MPFVEASLLALGLSAVSTGGMLLWVSGEGEDPEALPKLPRFKLPSLAKPKMPPVPEFSLLQRVEMAHAKAALLKKELEAVNPKPVIGPESRSQYEERAAGVLMVGKYLVGAEPLHVGQGRVSTYMDIPLTASRLANFIARNVPGAPPADDILKARINRDVVLHAYRLDWLERGNPGRKHMMVTGEMLDREFVR